MKKYLIKLDGNSIGTTAFEKADAPMGCVIGLIHFIKIDTPYAFFKNYSKEKNIVLNENEPEHLLINTQSIDGLSVFNEEDIEIKGMAVTVSGFEEDGYYIEVIGIAYPFFEEEFPHHVKAYESKFN